MMNTIKEIKLDQTNWIEVTIVNELDEVINCESFGDSDEYISLLNQRCSDFGVELSEDNLSILLEQKAKRKVLTSEELTEIARLTEAQRITSIKSEAGSIIRSRYSIEWQLNHPRVDATYVEQYLWIDRIRAISNEAELNGIEIGDILWQ